MGNATWFLFLSDLFHQILFYIGGVLALLELFMTKCLNTPLEKRLFNILVIGCLFIACFQAWVDEHHNAEQLINDKAAMAGERDFWKGQSYAKDASLRSQNALLTQSVSSLTALTNKVLDVTKSEPLKITVAGERLPYYGGSQPHEMILLAFPNKVVGQANVLIKCDREIQGARAAMFGHDLWMGKGVQVDGSEALVNITSPAWTPTQPLVAYVAFKGELAKSCTVTQL